jgi:hypothetical protein
MEEKVKSGRDSSARRVGPALEAAYQLVLWVVPTVDKYPRNLKFTLGDRTISAALDMLDRLIEATYARDRAGQLSAAEWEWDRFEWNGLHGRRHLTQRHQETPSFTKKVCIPDWSNDKPSYAVL